jgi:hypothetical protein
MMLRMELAWMAVGLLLCACGGSPAPQEVPPPPVPAYPVVGKTEAVVPLARTSRPNHVVWIGSTGGLELGQPDQVWTGALPGTRAPIANLDALVASTAPPPEPEPTDGSLGLPRDRIIDVANTGGDPWNTASKVAVIAVPARGFERVPASVGARTADDRVPLVLGSPAVAAASVVAVVTKVGARLGVAQRDQLAVLRLSFRPALPDDVLDDTRQRWVELHVGVDRIDVLSLPSNGRAVVPWKKGTIDVEALRAVYKGFGKEAPKLDVFVDKAVRYQRLIDTLVALDELGVTVLGLGQAPGALDQRLARVIALRAARASYTSTTAVLEVGRMFAQGDLDKREILRVMRTKLADFTACYEPELAKQPALAGPVTMQFFILPAGKVVSASANGLPVVGPCIAKKLETIEFPPPKGGGGVQVNFQVRFRPKDA